jgi:hypothetical protein
MHGQVAAISQDAPAIAQQQAAGAKLHTLKRMAAQPLGSTVIVSLRAGFLKLSWLVKELLLKSNTPEPAGRRAAAKERQQVHLMRTWWHGHRQHTIAHMQYKHSTAQHSTAQHSTAQHSTAQHSTAQHSTAQHCTAQSPTEGVAAAHQCPAARSGSRAGGRGAAPCQCGWC